MTLMNVSEMDPILRKAIMGMIIVIAAYPNMPHFFQSQIPIIKINWKMVIPNDAVLDHGVLEMKLGTK